VMDKFVVPRLSGTKLTERNAHSEMRSINSRSEQRETEG